MFILGNLIPYSPYSDYTHFKVFDSISEVDNNKPTLIIGWENLKKDYSIEDVDPLNRVSGNNTFWTFSNTEDRKFHDYDVHWFREYCYNELIKDINYKAIDPIQSRYSNIKDLYRLIDKFNGQVITYKYYNNVYLLLGNDLFGFDLDLYDRIGLRKSLAKRIKEFTDIFLDETKENLMSIFGHHLYYMNNEIKYIPYLYLKNESEKGCAREEISSVR